MKINHLFLFTAMAAVMFTACANTSGNGEGQPGNQNASTGTPPVAPAPVGPKSDALSTPVDSTAGGKVIKLDKQMFVDKIFDFEANSQTWIYKGDKPCIIDFYADWCRPCRMVAPLMEEFAAKYKGQILVYKLNTDEQREVAQAFGIRSIPTVFFCPMKGDPQATQGALPKEQFEDMIKKVLLNNK